MSKGAGSGAPVGIISRGVSDQPANAVKLTAFKGRKVVVYFYPAALTPGCTKQACDFRDNLGELNGAGLDVVGISPDKPEKLAKFRDAEGLTFPLLSDPERKVLTAYGAYGEKQNYGRTVMGVIRSTFVIDPKGKIKIMEIHDNGIGRDAKELLRKVKAAQYVASHPGEVCPAKWTPGAATLTPSLNLVGKI